MTRPIRSQTPSRIQVVTGSVAISAIAKTIPSGATSQTRLDAERALEVGAGPAQDEDPGADDREREQGPDRDEVAEDVDRQQRGDGGPGDRADDGRGASGS